MIRRGWIVIVIVVMIVLYVLQGPVVHGADLECAECQPLLGWFTKEDIAATKNNGLDTAKLQPGDILVTLSTHSLGWRHGHAGLVIDQQTVLECAVWGKDSILCDTSDWKKYADYAVLRVKDADEQFRMKVIQYAKDNLVGVPYHLSAGFIGPKAPKLKESYFGMQCSYLVWYAWNHFGYDLDGDGGRLVTPHDLLESELVEVVYSYGDLRTGG